MGTRIKEFIFKLKKINCSNLTLSKCQQWITFNAMITNEDVQKAKEAKIDLADLNKLLGITRLKTMHRIKNLCDAEISFLNGVHAQITVLKTDMPSYNSAIKVLNSRHPALAFMKATADVKKVNAEYKKRVINRSGERNFYKNGFIEQAENLLLSDSYIAISVGLIALTGRRPSEVLLTASFKKTRKKSIPFDNNIIKFTNCLIFSGQLKTKNSENARDNYLIPVLCKPELILTGLKRLRNFKNFNDLNCEIVNDSGKKRSPAQRVNAIASGQQKKCVQKYFKEFFQGNMTTYDLRHAYALLCSQNVNPNQVPKLLANILGHLDDDDSTMHSYMTLKIANS